MPRRARRHTLRPRNHVRIPFSPESRARRLPGLPRRTARVRVGRSRARPLSALRRNLARRGGDGDASSTFPLLRFGGDDSDLRNHGHCDSAGTLSPLRSSSRKRRRGIRGGRTGRALRLGPRRLGRNGVAAGKHRALFTGRRRGRGAAARRDLPRRAAVIRRCAGHGAGEVNRWLS